MKKDRGYECMAYSQLSGQTVVLKADTPEEFLQSILDSAKGEDAPLSSEEASALYVAVREHLMSAASGNARGTIGIVVEDDDGN